MDSIDIAKLPLPPYGTLSEQYKAILVDDWDKPMDDWDPTMSWPAFRDRTLTDMADNIWPRYDAASRQWRGKSLGFCVDAIDSELAIMIESFQRPASRSILEELPDYTADVPAAYQFSHHWHYNVEDGVQQKSPQNGQPWPAALKTIEQLSLNQGANFTCYYPDSDPKLFHSQFYTNFRPKLDGLFDYKVAFNRPRPYQTAQLFGHNTFQMHIGKIGHHTGLTPSMISGHCLQGILLSCKALEIWLDDGSASQAQTDALAQYAVDFGDRRVFAGVHYPSDNISSWVLALEIIPHIFRHSDEILSFALNAITKKSIVYSTIISQFPSHEPLIPSLEYLLRLTGNRYS